MSARDTAPTLADDRKVQEMIQIAIWAGAVAGVLYPIGLLNLLPDRVSNVAFMLFGPFFAVSAYGMRAFFARAHDSALNDVGHLLLVCAGVAFTLMATMQMSVYSLIPQYHRTSLAPDAATWSAMLRSVSSTQLGLDYAFDLFVSGGAILVSVAMRRHPAVPVALSVLGLFVGVSGIVLNTITFPENAGNAGLIDPAPFFGVWFGFVWLAIVLRRNWQRVPRPTT